MKKIAFIAICSLISTITGISQNLTFSQSPTVTFDAKTNNITIALHYGNSDQYTNSTAFKIGVYLSTNTTINTSDFRLKSFNQNVSTAGVFGTLNIPTFDLDDFIGSLSNGTYYVGAILDYENQVVEIDENNNTTYHFSPITVTLFNGVLTVPVLKSPLNNANQVATSTSLQWFESNEADSYDWELYQAAVLKQSGNVTALSVNVTLSSSTNYTWRVRAKKGATTTSYSGYFGFLSLIPAPTLRLPANAATNVSVTPILRWTKNPAATSYKFTVDNGLGTVITSGTVTDTFAVLTPTSNLQGNTKYYWYVRAYIGTVEGSKPTSFTFTTAQSTGVNDIEAIPFTTRLDQNFPNPFNPTTAINYHLSTGGMTTLIVYDAIGRETAVLVNEVKEAGTYSASFDGSKLSSGIYFAKIQSGERFHLIKMLMLK